VVAAAKEWHKAIFDQSPLLLEQQPTGKVFQAFGGKLWAYDARIEHYNGMIFLDLSCSQRNKTTSRSKGFRKRHLLCASLESTIYTVVSTRSGIEQLLFEVDRHPARVIGSPGRVPKPPLEHNVKP
jgi:hypothetical protein